MTSRGTSGLIVGVILVAACSGGDSFKTTADPDGGTSGGAVGSGGSSNPTGGAGADAGGAAAGGAVASRGGDGGLGGASTGGATASGATASTGGAGAAVPDAGAGGAPPDGGSAGTGVDGGTPTDAGTTPTCAGEPPRIDADSRSCGAGDCYCARSDKCFDGVNAALCCEGSVVCPAPVDAGAIECRGSHPIIGPPRTCGAGNCYCTDGTTIDVCYPNAIAARCCPSTASLTCIP